ncbi:unannotated protein [freshwater metagenome]|uniref:Unannotated protein n=1 Tax=freshwater metagenome TaxID=449393 RepID=A0A6J6B120_9ZZZZ
MLARALLVSFQQALRSIALTLFPLAFIALLAWATAGSSTGNTSDPIRASIWLWLGAHLILFDLSLPPSFDSGTLSILPLGAALLPLLAMRSGMNRSISALERVKPARIFFSFWYIAFILLATYLSRTSDVKPSLILAPLYALLLLVIASLDFSHRALAPFRFSAHILTVVAGIAMLLFGVSLALHFTIAKNLTTVLQPGWVGGVLLLLIQILYLPNLAIHALSYFLGFGFALGAATHISPTVFTIQQIPAIPILGGLPTGKHPLYLIGLTLFIVLALLVALSVIRRHSDLKNRIREFSQLILGGSIALALISYLSSGTLLTSALHPVGVRWWPIPAVFAASQLIFVVLVLLIPAAISKFRDRTDA